MSWLDFILGWLVFLLFALTFVRGASLVSKFDENEAIPPQSVAGQTKKHSLIESLVNVAVATASPWLRSCSSSHCSTSISRCRTTSSSACCSPWSASRAATRCAGCLTDGIKRNRATAKGHAVVRITRPSFTLTIQPKEQHMNQAELINAIAANAPNNSTSKTTVKAVLDELAKVAQVELKAGNEVTLPGLGKLSVKTSAARKGRNPATGAEIDIPAKQKPAFSAAKVLKDAVAG